MRHSIEEIHAGLKKIHQLDKRVGVCGNGKLHITILGGSVDFPFPSYEGEEVVSGSPYAPVRKQVVTGEYVASLTGLQKELLSQVLELAKGWPQHIMLGDDKGYGIRVP